MSDLLALAARVEAWQPISTAPKDGSPVWLTWMEDGEPQEIWPMVWNQFAENRLFQEGRGIWASHGSDGALLLTWTDHDPAGGPSHWAPRDPDAREVPASLRASAAMEKQDG